MNWDQICHRPKYPTKLNPMWATAMLRRAAIEIKAFLSTRRTGCNQVVPTNPPWKYNWSKDSIILTKPDHTTGWLKFYIFANCFDNILMISVWRYFSSISSDFGRSADGHLIAPSQPTHHQLTREGKLKTISGHQNQENGKLWTQSVVGSNLQLLQLCPSMSSVWSVMRLWS